MKTLDHNLNDAITGFGSLETYTQALGQGLQSCRFPFDWLIHDPFPTNPKTPAHSEILSETLTAMAFILTQTKDFASPATSCRTCLTGTEKSMRHSRMPYLEQ
ncbi:hypothetical protein [uncultured Faecalibaculum sp.]|uniref:hypothetical protein n=1 Tax=uncultured Faecalibaculum sp. TaxID=1729681 RepID=UPI0026374C9B|nr:hypothetical protein [uncultured Faecalibaculum sp.]